MKDTLLKKMASMTQDELFQALYTDPLTGVLNRRALEETEHRFIAIVDLDSLKYLNDTYGHRTGDQALKWLADTISNVFSTDNTYRISGDEFAVTHTSIIELINGLNEARQHCPWLSFGIGRSFETADTQLINEKQARESSGLRAPRGEMPPWIDLITNEQKLPDHRHAITTRQPDREHQQYRRWLLRGDNEPANDIPDVRYPGLTQRQPGHRRLVHPPH